MIIHVVQPGETINSIAECYGISAKRLIQENELTNPDNLVVGQTIVILYPKEMYTVRPGDSLESIASLYDISIDQLLRNNPLITCGTCLNEGDTIVIDYFTKKLDKITINGFAYPFISHKILKKTLPYLTYLSIYSYLITMDGDILQISDEEIIRLAKEYKVAPVMVITTFCGVEHEDGELAHIILSDPILQERLIENVLDNMKTKGYYALGIDTQNVLPEDNKLYEKFIDKFTKRLNREGYDVTVIVSPKVIEFTGEAVFENRDYTALGQAANELTMLNYQWGHTLRSPYPMITMNNVKGSLDKLRNQVPSDKISIGIPCIGYDWELPYNRCISTTSSMSYNAVIDLALEAGTSILFNINSQIPYYLYSGKYNKKIIQHIVCFRDARSIDVLVKLIPQYKMKGIAVWNIMQFFAQMWLVINNQYEIDKIF